MRLAKVVISAVFVNLLAAGGPALFCAPAHAQDFPSRNITIIVPFPAGGGNDIFGRLIGQRLAAAFGRTVIVDNRPGASGNIGAEAVVRAAPDGHTILYGNANVATTQVVPPKPAFDPQRDLAPVSMTVLIPFVLVSHPSLPVRNVKDLLALAKAKPGDLTFSAGSTGSIAHLAMALLKLNTKLDARHVPYKGAAPSVVALLSGEVQISFLVPPVVQPQIRNGKARGLAVSSLKRSTVLPDIPTLHEAGVRDFEALQWHGLFAPAKTPPAIVTRIHAEVVKALASSEMKERLAAEGAEVVGSAPTEFAAFFRSEIKKWSEVVQRSGTKFE
jgi:tripartite-type tricarboxylate transporter receptor subunit TctC